MDVMARGVSSAGASQGFRRRRRLTRHRLVGHMMRKRRNCLQSIGINCIEMSNDLFQCSHGGAESIVDRISRGFGLFLMMFTLDW